MYGPYRKSNSLLPIFVVFVSSLVLLVIYVQRTLSSLSAEVAQNRSFQSNRLRKYDVTMLTHTSIQRLFFIPHIVNRWEGPISMTIYTKSNEEMIAVDSLVREQFFPKSVHILRYLSPTPTEYPYNRLRNMALRDITTSHFWVMDMDMWPSDNLYSQLLHLDTHYLQDDYLAVITPSFEYKSDMSKCNDFEKCVNEIIPFVPHSLSDLQNCLAMEKCDEFRRNYFVHNYLTPQWYDPTIPQQLMLVPCFKSYKQEPYVMVKRSIHLPEFDERFVNYGKDKISWIENLRYDGYQFAVLRGAFAVDVPHPRSDFAKKFYDVLMNEGAEKWDMNVAYTQFKKELKQKKDNSIVYFCDESNNAQ